MKSPKKFGFLKLPSLLNLIHKNWRIEKRKEKKGLLNKSRVYTPGFFFFFFFQFCGASQNW